MSDGAYCHYCRKYACECDEGVWDDEPRWVLTLNKYQRDNLLWLINACGWPGGQGIAPFTLANTGDWIGEVGFMLKTEGQAGLSITEADRPNVSSDELRKRIEDWKKEAIKNLTPIVVSDSLLPQEQYKDILEIYKAFSLSDEDHGTSG